MLVNVRVTDTVAVADRVLDRVREAVTVDVMECVADKVDDEVTLPVPDRVPIDVLVAEDEIVKAVMSMDMRIVARMQANGAEQSLSETNCKQSHFECQTSSTSQFLYESSKESRWWSMLDSLTKSTSQK